MKKQNLPNNLLRFSQMDINVHHKKCKYQGFFNLDEYQLSHKLFSGGTSDILTREVFERGDAVVMMPYDPITDKLYLLEQFRPGAIRQKCSPWLLEFIAGMFSKNESPVEVAIREAEEEADLKVDKNDLLPIMNYFSSPGGMSEKIHLYVGRVNINETDQLNSGRNSFGLREEGEDILLHVVSREQAMDLLDQGKINNASTIIGLQWLSLNYKTLQTKWLSE